MRHVIIHYHIFKNAGSTIDSILKNQFGKAYGNIEGHNPWDTLDTSLLLQYSIDNPTYQVISSHQARFPVPTSPRINFYPIIFLRHPIDRAGSVYSFERRQPLNNSSSNSKIAHESDINDYIRWRLADNHGAVIKNFQTIYVASQEKDMRTAIATKVDLETAMNRMRELRFFGIVELFQESMLRMQDYLVSDFGVINTSFTVQNKSLDRKRTLTERLDNIKASLSPLLYNELIDKNALDLEFYNQALKLFKSKPNSINP